MEVNKENIVENLVPRNKNTPVKSKNSPFSPAKSSPKPKTNVVDKTKQLREENATLRQQIRDLQLQNEELKILQEEQQRREADENLRAQLSYNPKRVRRIHELMNHNRELHSTIRSQQQEIDNLKRQIEMLEREKLENEERVLNAVTREQLRREPSRVRQIMSLVNENQLLKQQLAQSQGIAQCI